MAEKSAAKKWEDPSKMTREEIEEEYAQVLTEKEALTERSLQLKQELDSYLEAERMEAQLGYPAGTVDRDLLRKTRQRAIEQSQDVIAKVNLLGTKASNGSDQGGGE